MAFRVVSTAAAGVEDVLATLARTLRDTALHPGLRVTQADASPDEGLALLAHYLTIKDPSHRQAVVDLAALLAAAADA